MKPSRISLITDETAADALPMRFTVAAILIAIIGLLVASSVLDLMSTARTHEAQTEISKIVSNAEQMAVRGAGSVVTLEIDIPNDVTVILGALPKNRDEWPRDAENYYIQSGSKSSVYETDAAFSNIEVDDAVELSEGPHRLTLESVYNSDHGKLFVLVYERYDDGS
ncbi:MAG: hypothetical protein M8350_05940 [Methanosarcinaceae archaeon]|nr:hypothetical protein [Methanosarcinaceae archaeon]